MKILFQNVDSGDWEVNETKLKFTHKFKKHPLITIVREYKTVTEQQAYDDALVDINAIIAAAHKVRRALISKNSVLINNLADNTSREVEKI